jgi:translation initiation factor 3 subunit L
MQGVIHVTESKVGRRFGDYFIRNINKMEELAQSLER